MPNSKKSVQQSDQSSEVHTQQCKECFAVFIPEENQNPVICPYCGYEFPIKLIKSRIIEEDETGTLQKIEGFHFSRKTPQSCKTYQELLNYAREHGYKPGWAWYQAKERGML